MSLSSPNHANRTTPPGPANERFKARYRTVFWGSILVAAVVHGAVLWLSPTLGELPGWLSTIDRLALAPPVEARPAPEPPPADPGPLPDAGFEPIPTPAVPHIEDVEEPPADDVLAVLARGPRFTPYDVAPELENRAALVDALFAAYPHGSPGVPDRLRTVLWFFIDEYGTVRQTLIRESSGHAELDTIIVEAAAVAKFSPAWSVDRNVPAWVSLPVSFRITPPEGEAADTAGATPRT